MLSPEYSENGFKKKKVTPHNKFLFKFSELRQQHRKPDQGFQG
jgi:hypothetical protein